MRSTLLVCAWFAINQTAQAPDFSGRWTTEAAATSLVVETTKK